MFAPSIEKENNNKKYYFFYKYDKNNKILAHKTNCNETCDNFH
jgi:hypothetical protein